MSTKAVGWALDQRPRNATAKLVLIALADYAGDNGESWYRRKRLADVCLVALSTLDAALDSLARDGFIAIEPRHRDDGSHTSNLYRILVPGLPISSGGLPIIGRGSTIIGHHDPISDPISDPTSEANASSVAPAANVKVKKQREPLSPEQRQKLITDFGDVWEPPEAAQRIEEALNHKAVDKAKSEYLYLRNWLRNDAKRERGTNARSNNPRAGTGFQRSGAGPGRSTPSPQGEHGVAENRSPFAAYGRGGVRPPAVAGGDRPPQADGR